MIQLPFGVFVLWVVVSGLALGHILIDLLSKWDIIDPPVPEAQRRLLTYPSMDSLPPGRYSRLEGQHLLMLLNGARKSNTKSVEQFYVFLPEKGEEAIPQSFEVTDAKKILIIENKK